MVALLLLAALQDNAEVLVERLADDDPSVREDAGRRLTRMGTAAAPILERAARSDDLEVAVRARRILPLLPIVDRLTPRLMDLMSGVEARLANGGAHAWTEVFLEAADHNRQPGLLVEHLEPLVSAALDGVAGPRETVQILQRIPQRRLHGSAPRVEAMLLDADASIRTAALDAWVHIHRRQAIPALVRALDDVDVSVRRHALGKLMNLRAREALPSIAAMLRDPDAALRAGRARIVPGRRKRGSNRRDARGPGAAESLERCRGVGEVGRDRGRRRADGDARRRVFRRPLGRIGHRDAVPKLVDMLDDEAVAVRDAAVRALILLKATETLPRLLEFLDREQPAERACAVRAIGELGDPEMFESLEPHLREPKTRAAALEAAAALSRRGAMRAFLALLNHADPTVRAAVPGKLEAMKGAPPDMEPLLRDSDPSVRATAATWLSRRRLNEAIPSLLPLLGDGDPAVVIAALRGVVGIDRAEAERIVLPLLDHADARVRAEALTLLANKQARKALPRAVVLLDADEPSTRRSAAMFLWMVKSPSSLPHCIARLSDPDTDVRRTALYAVAALGPGDDPAPIFARLDDENTEIRRTAVSVIAKFKREIAVPALMKLLEDPRPPIRAEAFRQLGALQIRDAVEPLRALLASKEGSDRALAAEALGRIGARETAEEILPLLGDPLMTCTAAAWALGLLEARELTPKIVPFLKHESPLTRKAAVELLGKFDALEAIPPLLDDPDRETRWKAAEALKRMRGEAAIALWRTHVLSAHHEIRRSAVDMLGILGDTESVPAVLVRLRDEDSGVRGAAAVALGRLGAREAVPELIGMLHDTPGAAEALAALGANEAIPSIVELTERADGQTALTACLALLKLDEARGRDRLLHLLEREASSHVRQRVALALADLGAGEAIPELIRGLEVGYTTTTFIDSVRTARLLRRLGARDALPPLIELMHASRFTMTINAAITVIGYLDLPEAAPEIVRHLEDADPTTRYHAVWALGELGAESAMPAIRGTLDDEDANVRLYAAGALHKLGSTEGADVCMRLLDHEDARVQAQAAEVLAKMRRTEAAARIRGLLSNEDALVRRKAAAALCALGEREGVDELLGQDGALLLYLNCLRRPDVCRRLGDTPLERDVEGPVRDVLAQLATEAGLKLELAEPRTDEERSWLAAERWIRSRGGRTTLAAALETAVMGAPYRFEAVLEADRIRMLPRDEAVVFWRRWWDDERGR